MDVRKDFGGIENDYAFFEAHVDEIPHNTAAMAPIMRAAAERARLRLLDVGCGEGHFLGQLLDAVDIAPERLEIGLVEPFDGYRQRAVEGIARFSDRPLQAWPLTRDVPAELRFDCVISHHVLYYVKNLDGTLDDILRVVERGGVFLPVMANPAHPLPLMWHAAFGALGREVPFFEGVDLARALDERGVPFEVVTMGNCLSFDDTTENRMRIIRFTFGETLGDVDIDLCLGCFDPYAVAGRIEMPHPDDLYVIKPG